MRRAQYYQLIVTFQPALIGHFCMPTMNMKPKLRKDNLRSIFAPNQPEDLLTKTAEQASAQAVEALREDLAHDPQTKSLMNSVYAS